MNRKMIIIVFVIISVLVMSACGNNSSPPSTSNTEPSSNSNSKNADVDLTYMQQQIDQYKTLPEFIAPGPEFDAKKVMAGKKNYDHPGIQFYSVYAKHCIGNEKRCCGSWL